ncbi:hypothetical protein BOSEA31B_14531 [Hyphomicrobiales bacterium]|nr:hypothetical protein BOSEA31B_14531 [Hyphomicrobiales bacterium]CAH1701026.1 hypothetical protein BOSEA1005_20725 [Hyphomicrobiales bacterium]CAI0344085.1 hypothetical protein BO1005MUT1_310114 [Hyphomicrobiales bacterium]
MSRCDLLPSPLWGRVWGWGSYDRVRGRLQKRGAQKRKRSSGFATPTPAPPHKGEGFPRLFRFRQMPEKPRYIALFGMVPGMNRTAVGQVWVRPFVAGRDQLPGSGLVR